MRDLQLNAARAILWLRIGEVVAMLIAIAVVAVVAGWIGQIAAYHFGLRGERVALAGAIGMQIAAALGILIMWPRGRGRERA